MFPKGNWISELLGNPRIGNRRRVPPSISLYLCLGLRAVQYTWVDESVSFSGDPRCKQSTECSADACVFQECPRKKVMSYLCRKG